MTYWYNRAYESDIFFWWHKDLIKSARWSALSPSAKAVFPVLAIHANTSGISYPSEDTVAALSGITPKTVRNGIRGLEDFCGITWERYLTARGRYSKKIRVDLPKKNNSDCFPFFRKMLDSGKWFELSPSGKALYPVMRCFSFLEYEDCTKEESDDIGIDFFRRDYDKCQAEKSVMAELEALRSHPMGWS
jgi:hypothetical protein